MLFLIKICKIISIYIIKVLYINTKIMITQSLWNIQKNIWIISENIWIIKVVDKRKKEHIATIIPKKRSNKITQIWGIFKDKISEDKKNISFEKVRDLAKEIYFNEKKWKN